MQSLVYYLMHIQYVFIITLAEEIILNYQVHHLTWGQHWVTKYMS